MQYLTEKLNGVYIGDSAPTSTSNLSTMYLNKKYYDSSTGDYFICLDDTVNANMWKNITKNEIITNRDPNQDDDISIGIIEGFIWTNNITMDQFICISNQDGAAVWETYPEVTTEAPLLSAINDSNELTTININIINYSSSSTYNIIVSGGTVVQNSDVISWTLPDVVGDTQHQITVTSQEPGKMESSPTIQQLMVIDKRTPAPVISSDGSGGSLLTEANMNTDVTFYIDNYSSENTYNITGDGSVIQSGNTVVWTLPEVSEDELKSITITATETGFSESAGVVYSIKDVLVGIQRPTILTPFDGSTDQRMNIDITLSEYEIKNISASETHKYTVYQIADNSALNNPIEKYTDKYLTNYTADVLQENKNYYIRVKYYSENYESAWSEIIQISTKTTFSYEEIQKITPFDGDAGHNFGYSVSIENNYCLIGAPGWDNSGYLDQGAVYFYKKENNQWVFDSILEQPTPSSNSRFGTYVKLSDTSNRFLVTAPYEDDLGAVYVYELVNGSINLIDKFQPSDNNNIGMSANFSHKGIRLIYSSWDVNNNKNVLNEYVWDPSTLKYIPADTEALNNGLNILQKIEEPNIHSLVYSEDNDNLIYFNELEKLNNDADYHATITRNTLEETGFYSLKSDDVTSLYSPAIFGQIYYNNINGDIYTVQMGKHITTGGGFHSDLYRAIIKYTRDNENNYQNTSTDIFTEDSPESVINIAGCGDTIVYSHNNSVTIIDGETIVNDDGFGYSLDLLNPNYIGITNIKDSTNGTSSGAVYIYAK